MPISWAAALRMYGKQKGAFVVPKKGSSDYDAIKKIQQETEMSPEHEVKRRQRRPKGKDTTLAVPEGGVNASLPPPTVQKSKTKPLEDAGGAGSRAEMFQEKPKVEDAAAVPEKAGKKGLARSGKTKKADTVQELTDRNLGDGGALAPSFAGQKEGIKKQLAQNRKTDRVVSVGNGEERTLEGMKTNDPAAVEGRAPFSIQSLRNRLLC